VKKLIPFFFSLLLFLFVVSPSYASQTGISGNFTASDVNFDPSTGVLSLNYSGQDLSTCNALAIYPYNSLYTVDDYNSNNIFYDSGGPNHYLLCDDTSANGVLGSDKHVSFFNYASSYVFMVRNLEGWYLSQPIANPYYTPKLQVVSFSGATINEGDTYHENGYFDDFDQSASSWTATVDYGDGSGVQNVPVSDFSFPLNHQYTTAGTYTVTTTVTNNIGATGTGTATVIVTMAGAQPPHVNPLNGDTINEGSTYIENGSFTDSDSTSWTATIDYGDESGIQPLSLNTDKIFALNHTYKDNGNYTVRVVVIDNQQNTGTTMTNVIVSNVSSSVGMVTASINPILINTNTTASATFTDPGMLDTHTASWSWGDGTSTNGTVTESNGSGSVLNSHSYTAPGVYTVTLIVTDKDNGQGTSVYQYVSAYATTTKSVSGSKEYVSPTGALIGNPTVTGAASFGFTAQYDNSGNVVPQGNKWASLTLKNGNTTYVNFNTTAYTSLVVSGAKVTLQGAGTYNGNSGYRVLITAIDGTQTGGQDLVRYQIKNSLGTVVYDTQPGAALTAEPTTPVSKGKITVN
jgi:hypothetical protein